MEDRELTDEQRSILRQCLWDLTLTPEAFLAILEGRLVQKWPDQAFCMARLLESVNWFDIIEVIEPERLCSFWSESAKKKVRFKPLKDGMDFACRVLQ
ncbi:MAG: hypothetical protein EPN22_02300 [Nitrospirae bacterium]|nr:MAG: hypothetical protein EPN22_02300 [Nitrospirota bacterium]